MPRVIVNDAAQAEAGDLRISVNEGARSFRLRAPRHYNAIVDQLRPRVRDLLLIAAAVFATDSRQSRGGDVREDLGAAWTRDLSFVVPVLDVQFWRSQRDTLTSTLDFLTGDRFSFEFVQGRTSSRLQPTLSLPGGIPRADDVVLFSGGLDSLAGAFEILTLDPSKKVVLVTHRSANKTASVQVALAHQLQERFPEQVLWVPALGTLVGAEAEETTQRSRSFLYAALGYAAASLVGTSHFYFFENGIVSTNLQIDRQVMGSMATRTTHPLFLTRMERLLSVIAGRAICIQNPYQRLTKTEVVERLARIGGAELIAQTNSCSGVRQRTSAHPHCGRCSQCLDRRFAILAAHAEQHDPAENYGVELWRGIRSSGRDRTLAIDWIRHGRRLVRIGYSEFAAAFGAELAYLVAAYPRQSSAAVTSEAFDLHRRHGEAVRRVIAQAIEDSKWLVVDGEIPADSLLGAVFADAAPDSSPRSFLPKGSPSLDAPAASSASDLPELRVVGAVFPLRIALVPDPESVVVWIAGLGRFEGKHLMLIAKLKPHHDSALRAPLKPSEHPYVPARRLGAPQGTVGQHARRCRAAIVTECSKREVPVPSSQPLVQSRKHHGYRIDPEVRFVDDVAEVVE